jgi:hypothetical protein
MNLQLLHSVFPYILYEEICYSFLSVFMIMEYATFTLCNTTLDENSCPLYLVYCSSAVEVPSYFLSWYVMDKWGRRWVLFETMMIGGLSCISCIFVPPGMVKPMSVYVGNPA